MHSSEEMANVVIQVLSNAPQVVESLIGLSALDNVTRCHKNSARFLSRLILPILHLDPTHADPLDHLAQAFFAFYIDAACLYSCWTRLQNTNEWPSIAYHVAQGSSMCPSCGLLDVKAVLLSLHNLLNSSTLPKALLAFYEILVHRRQVIPFQGCIRFQIFWSFGLKCDSHQFHPSPSYLSQYNIYLPPPTRQTAAS